MASSAAPGSHRPIAVLIRRCSTTVLAVSISSGCEQVAIDGARVRSGVYE
ncbi:hypothetical protein [Streptomyces sp. BRA346]